MAFCTKCGAACALGIRICTGCGNQISNSAGEVKSAALLIEVAFGCRSCGALLAEGQSFCVKCGRSLKTATSPQPTPFTKKASTPVEIQATPKNADVVAATPVLSLPPKLVETQPQPPRTEDAAKAPPVTFRAATDTVITAPPKLKPVSSLIAPSTSMQQTPPSSSDISAVPALTSSEGSTKLKLSGIIVAMAMAATGAYFLLYGSGQSAHIEAVSSPVASKPATPDTLPSERVPQAIHAAVAIVEAKPDLASVPSPTRHITAPLSVAAQSGSGVKPSTSRTAPSVKVSKTATVQASLRKVAASVVAPEVKAPAPVASDPRKIQCGDVVARGAGFLNQTCEKVGVEAFTTCTNEGGKVFDNCKPIGTTTCGELAGFACSQSQF